MSANGHLAERELAPIVGGGQLSNAAAAAWNAMSAHIHKESGQQIGINGPDSAYRPVARQVYWRNYWCSQGACQNAAVPGTSNHGLGLAVDVPDATRTLIARYGEPFGWDRGCSDAPWELWHHKWCGGWEGDDPGPSDKTAFPTIKAGDRNPAVGRAQRLLRDWNLGITRPEVDGDFGPTTHRAVVEFQAIHHLKGDGVVGKHTWRKLRREDALGDEERLHLNRLRLLERHGVGHRETSHAREHRIWFASRALWMERQGSGWWNNRRKVRHHIVQREAGHQYRQLKEEEG
jgi:Putative peptidoglycan binding domain/D-alanyl-D-alanine carboxypeptidase